MQIYVRINNLCKEDESVLEECRNNFKKLEDGDPYCVEIWKKFRELSLKEFDKVYDILGVKFDSLNGEAFYADKMCISPKYLTMLITDNTGRSAKEWIVEYTILEIKVLLKDSNLEIKEVVSRTNFQSNSTMTRFFRKHTGTTEYRERMFV